LFEWIIAEGGSSLLICDDVNPQGLSRNSDGSTGGRLVCKRIPGACMRYINVVVTPGLQILWVMQI
jgi:hypothetical protein